jgi:hypothetical protein
LPLGYTSSRDVRILLSQGMTPRQNLHADFLARRNVSCQKPETNCICVEHGNIQNKQLISQRITSKKPIDLVKRKIRPDTYLP